MKQYQYGLEKYKSPASNIICHGCGEKRAKAYINNATGERLGNHVSRCERVDSCGYNFTPKMFFEENPEAKPQGKWTPPPPPPPPIYSYVSKELFDKTLGYNEKNTFHRFLLKWFGHDKALELIDKFSIGSTKKNDTIFWRIDAQQRILTSRIFRYNAIKSDKTFFKIDCKREKEPPISRWVHTEFNLKSYEDLPHCFFAENLIGKNKDVAIVESAKTVIIASVYLPCYSWIACETMTGLNLERLERLLTGRNVILFPDLKALDEWKAKAEMMKRFCSSVVVVDTLEEIADQSEIKAGDDVADFLLKEAPPAETLPAVSPIEPAPEALPAVEEKPKISNDDFKKNCEVLDFWNKRLNLFDENSFMVVDGAFISDIRAVIIRHVKAVHEDNSCATVSMKFLEKIKY